MSQFTTPFDAWQTAQADLYLAISAQALAVLGEDQDERPIPGKIDNLRLMAGARARLLINSVEVGLSH